MKKLLAALVAGAFVMAQAPAVLAQDKAAPKAAAKAEEKKADAKAKVEAGRGLWEFRLEADELAKFSVGGELKADEIFSVGQIVDVAGITKGKGFQGTIKRHNFKMGDATHGNSLSHRAPGSIGQRQTPGRVFPGKKMSGHMGAVRRSAMNLEVVKIDAERHLIAIKGSVPGAQGGNVIIRPAVKA